jgi:hypothetical protein
MVRLHVVQGEWRAQAIELGANLPVSTEGKRSHGRSMSVDSRVQFVYPKILAQFRVCLSALLTRAA